MLTYHCQYCRKFWCQAPVDPVVCPQCGVDRITGEPFPGFEFADASVRRKAEIIQEAFFRENERYCFHPAAFSVIATQASFWLYHYKYYDLLKVFKELLSGNEEAARKRIDDLTHAWSVEIALKLPRLKGSPKQVAWARVIRAQLASGFNEAEAEKFFTDKCNAKYWIENRRVVSMLKTKEDVLRFFNNLYA